MSGRPAVLQRKEDDLSQHAIESFARPTVSASLEAGEPQAKSMTDLAYARIVDLILTRDLRPGERTSVNLLAFRLDLGRMPVKEAVNRLQGEGVLSVKGRSGTTVADVDAEGAEHMFALRRALEDLAAESAVTAVTAADLERIEGLVEDMRKASIEDPGAAGAGPRFVRANALFHAAVVRAAHNPFLDRAYGQLQLQFQIVAYLSHRGVDHEAASRRQAEHEAIAVALAARDRATLRDRLRSHSASTEHSLRAHLASKRLTP